MGDQQGRFALLLQYAPDIRRYRQPCLVVQGGKGLIQQQYLRLSGQGPDQGAALAHTAGELAGPLFGKGRQPIALQQPGHVGIGRRVLLTTDRQPQRHVVPYIPPLEKLVPLGHKADLWRCALYRPAVDLDDAAAEGLQTGNGAEQGGFAAAGGPH